MGKLLEELILQRLQSFLAGENGLSENQFRFRKGRSTVNAIQAVVDIATNAWRETGKRKGLCALIGIDIHDAFNTAKSKICIEAMVQKKVPDYLLRKIDEYLSNRWVIYEGDKWSLKEEKKEKSLELLAGTSIIGFVDDALVVSAAEDVRILELRINESWIAEVWKWPLKRQRLCWSRTGDPFSARGSFSENMRLSRKQASSIWGCNWIQGLTLANTFTSQLLV